MSVTPLFSAASIPAEVEAARDTIIGIPAFAALETIPTGCLPVHPMTHSAGFSPLSVMNPIALSTVLCRPISENTAACSWR